jgi:3-hydroxyisobutyrate dehydrogenase
MGSGILRRLVDAGFDVTAFDVRPEARARADELGARSTDRLERLGEHALVALVVVNDEQALDVAARLLPELGEGSTLVVHSTVLPETMAELERQAGRHGIGVVDAPVTGGAVAAAEGRLALLVGGEDEPVERALPELEALGTVHRMGPLGTGQKMKIVNNMMQFGHYALAHEGLKLAEALGIDPERARAVAVDGSASCHTLRHLDRIDALNAAQRDTRASWLGKDAWFALLLGKELEVRLPVSAVVYQVMHGYVEERVERVRAAGNPVPVA